MPILTEFARRWVPQLGPVGAAAAGWPERTVAILREFGPYAAIELFLPGGSLLALLLWVCRRHPKAAMRVRTLAGSLWKFLRGSGASGSAVPFRT
jgi:hypothetical protein